MARRPTSNGMFSDEQLKLLAGVVISDNDAINERLLALVRRHFDEGLTVHSRFEEALCHVYAMGMQYAMNVQPKRRSRKAKVAPARDPNDDL